MNTTLWILLGVGLLAAGVVAFLLWSPADTSPSPMAIVTEERTPAPSPAEVKDPTTTTLTDEGREGTTGVADAQPQPVQTGSVSVEDLPQSAPALWAIDGVIDLDEYRNASTFSDVHVHWQNDATHLRMALESPGTGYIAIGFDPDRRMEGANYIIGYVEEGVAYLRDDFGTGPTMHTDDTERGGTNDILSSAGAEWADHTVIEFIIPLDSGDAMDKPLRPGQTVEVLIAYHDLVDGFTGRHSRRGGGEIRLDPAP